MMNRKAFVAAGVVAAAFCGSAMAQELPGLPGVPGVPGVPGLPELPTLPEISGSIGAGLGLGLLAGRLRHAPLPQLDFWPDVSSLVAAYLSRPQSHRQSH